MNIGILFSYLGLGLMLAAPIGPVNSARLDKGIKNGFWHAWIVGLGAIVADACFMGLVYLGLVHFIKIPFIQIFLWLFGGFLLVYTGIEAMRTARNFQLDYRSNPDTLFSCFVTGFLITISSPLSILFWLGIYGSVLAETAATYGISHILLYSSMIFLGISCWDVFVATLTTGFKRFFNYRMLVIISMLSGLSLVIFGLYFIREGIKAMFGH